MNNTQSDSLSEIHGIAWVKRRKGFTFVKIKKGLRNENFTKFQARLSSSTERMREKMSWTLGRSHQMRLSTWLEKPLQCWKVDFPSLFAEWKLKTRWICILTFALTKQKLHKNNIINEVKLFNINKRFHAEQAKCVRMQSCLTQQKTTATSILTSFSLNFTQWKEQAGRERERVSKREIDAANKVFNH